MDFRWYDEQQVVSDLAAQLFGDKATTDRVREVESDHGHDQDLWRILAAADLLGVSIPEEHGGAGLGLLGLVALLEQQGRRVAPVPLWSAIATAAMPIAEFGSSEQRQRLLPPFLSGEALLAGAFDLDAGGELPVRGEAAPDGWRLRGELVGVAGAGMAMALVVPFRADDGIRVAVIAGDAHALDVRPVATTGRGDGATVVLDGVLVSPSDILGDDGELVLDWVRTRARIALAALAVGVCQEATTITASYTSQRIQFDRPLSTNQAVALRAADAYIDTERIRLTTYQAAWHADRGQESEARAAALVAKWWASVGGLRVVHATQHLHGGIGADVDYPIHRYFLWGRQIAFSLGSAGAVEVELGDLLDVVPRIGAPA